MAFGTNQPPEGFTPEVLAAEQAIAEEVLDYNPNLSSAIPSGSALPTTLFPIPPRPSPLHVASTHLLTVSAVYKDLIALDQWLNESTTTIEGVLQTMTIPTSGGNIPAAISRVISSQFGPVITFSDLQGAYSNPTGTYSNLVRQTWDAYHWGMNGNLAAQYYGHLVTYRDQVVPPLITTAKNLLNLSTFSILGSATQTPTDNLQSIASSISSPPTYNQNLDSLSGYASVADSLVSLTGGITSSVQAITSNLNAQQGIPNDAILFATGLMVVSDLTGGPVAGDIQAILGFLIALRTILLILNNASYAGLIGILQNIWNLAQELLYTVLTEVVSIEAHIQNQVMYPVLAFLRDIQVVYSLISPASKGTITPTLQGVTKILQDLVGKFNQVILDMYRHVMLISAQVNKSTGLVQNNSQLRNLYGIINQLITILESISRTQIPVAQIPSTLGQNLQSIPSATPVLPNPPTPTVTTPPIGQPISQLAGKTYGIPPGDPKDIMAKIIEEIGSIEISPK